MFDTLPSLFDRLGSDAYDISAVAVELLLIGLCVNWSASVLHGTRGTRPLRGVLIILVVATMVVRVLSIRFGWVRLDLLYSYVLYGLAFIALVVFQPELRRAVIRIGDVRLRLNRAPQSQLVAALVKSAGYLSRNRYGALIALQRRVDLTGWAENGTIMRAEVSPNLLNTIFFPNSPLHDLGVIIRGKRVLAANCQFPAAESDEIDAALGSRHLAAVGMSYETDALVLVISEETGVVSLADNGKLTRYLSLDDLGEELTQRLTGQQADEPREGEQRRFGSALWATVRRLLVVVPLTLVIWYLADQATLSEASVKVQLSVRHDGPRQIVDVRVPAPPIVFTGTFSGPVRAIDRLRLDAAEQPLRATWILPEAYSRRGTYTLLPREITAIISGLNEVSMRGLTVVDVAMDELKFNVDELVTLRIPVQVDGGAARISVESIEPPDAEVVVRRNDLDRLPPEGQRTIRAPLGDRLEGLPPEVPETFPRVPLAEDIGGVALAEVTPADVRTTVRLVGQRRRIDNVVVHLFVSPDVLERYDVVRSDLNEWRISVEVEGEESIVEGLAPVDIYAFAHVRSALAPALPQPDETLLRSVDVMFEAPPGVVVVEQRSVRVKLSPRASVTP